MVERSDDGSRSSYGTSRSLIDLVRADDAEAWQRLVTLYAPLVAHWCRQSHLRPEDVDDVFQEVFQAVAAHVGAFRMDRTSDTFRGWLRAITLNKIRDSFRKQGCEPRAVGGSEANARWSRLPSPDDDLAAGGDDSEASSSSADEARLERRLFQRGLEMIRGEFEPRTWQAFWLTTVEGRPTKDVAAELSMTSGAVRVAKSRVLHRLRAELGDLFE